MKLAQLAQLARVELVGPGDVDIVGVTDLAHAHPHAMVMVLDPRQVPAADASPAGALLVGRDAPPTIKPALRAVNVRAAFARLLGAFALPVRVASGTHPSAVVAPDATIGSEVSIGPFVVIEAGVAVGARTTILAGAVIGARARIGEDCLLHRNATIYPDCVLGDRVIVHSGAVIGSDGYGYAAENGVHLKIPHLGRVVIEDDVEIGANSAVDRATLGETRIGRGTKIDNLVQVAHNVFIGEGSLLVALSGVAGSATIGPGVILAGQAGIGDHVSVGAGARVLGQAGVTKDVAPGATVSGLPAHDHRTELRVQAAVRRLPELLTRLQALEASLSAPPTRRPRRPRRPR